MRFLDPIDHGGKSLDVLTLIKVSAGLEQIEREILLEALYYGPSVAPSLKLLSEALKLPISIIKFYLNNLERQRLIYKVSNDKRDLFTTYKVNIQILSSENPFIMR